MSADVKLVASGGSTLPSVRPMEALEMSVDAALVVVDGVRPSLRKHTAEAIRDALDSRRHYASVEFPVRQQILASISDFDAATVYFRDTHPKPGSREDHYVVVFSQAFRRMSRVEWSNYIGRQISITSQLVALFEEHSQLSAENH